MRLTPEQTQLLQTYMQKNRNIPQPVQASPVPINVNNAGGGSGLKGIASLLGAVGGFFDEEPMQGPVQPGAEPLPQGEKSWLSQFADRLDPEAAERREFLEKQKSQPKIDTQQILSLLAKAGIK